MLISTPSGVLINDYCTLGERYQGTQTGNKRFNTFLVCKRVLVNPDNTRTKSAANVLIFSLGKPLKYMHFNCHVKIVKLY